MITEGILNALQSVIFALFSWINIPSINDFSSNLYDALDFLADAVYSTLSIINLFLPWDIIKFGIPIIVIVMNFEHIYNFIMWVIKKIPMLGVK